MAIPADKQNRGSHQRCKCEEPGRLRRHQLWHRHLVRTPYSARLRRKYADFLPSFTGGTCSGGHGLSIGSVGGRSDNDVANVVFSDSTVSNSQNGVRVKTISGATGSVKNVVG